MKMLWICAKQNYCVKCLNYNTYVISLLGYVMHNICIVTAAFKKLDLSYCSHCIPFFFLCWLTIPQTLYKYRDAFPHMNL